ncbi:hypothetical protein ACN28S_25625 [Cystobacter fuscus]
MTTTAVLALSAACGGPLEQTASSDDALGILEGSLASALTVTKAVSIVDATLERGQTVSASVTYTNNGTSAVTAKNIVLTSRAPGGTHAGGPVYDLTPRITNRTLQPGESVTLTATRVLASTDPLGTWELYPTWEDSSSTGSMARGSPSRSRRLAAARRTRAPPAPGSPAPRAPACPRASSASGAAPR